MLIMRKLSNSFIIVITASASVTVGNFYYRYQYYCITFIFFHLGTKLTVILVVDHPSCIQEEDAANDNQSRMSYCGKKCQEVML